MALIGTIRKNGWILIVAMTLALGGFILMDIVSNSQRYTAGDVNTLGKVNGEVIKRSEFENYEKLVYTKSTGNTLQIRSQIWDYFVQQAVISQEADKIGLGVCKDELMDLQFGNNISPVIAERFKDDSGRPNLAMLNSVKSAIESGQFTDPVNRAYWAVQEKEIVKRRLEDKLVAMASKGLYTPTWQAEMIFHESNDRLDFRYVMIPYDRVKDAEAPVSDADYKAFLDENPHLYDQKDESRVLAMVEFDVKPTSADSAASRASLAGLVEGFRTATNDSAFVAGHDGELDKAYKSKSVLPAVVADTLLRLPIGTVVGPYIDGNDYKLAKILDRKVVPDSVRARHILIRDAKNPATKNTIDSLFTLIQSGKQRFDSLAVKVSQDPGSGKKGGDLGWFPENAMVPEFNEICFYTGEQGKLYKVATQFGWHIIEITGKKFIKNSTNVKAAYISHRIEPSKATQQAMKDKAQAVVQSAKTLDDLVAQGGQQGFLVQNSPALKNSDFTVGSVGAGEDARTMVRWAFDEKTKVGAVSPEIFVFRDPQGGYFDSKYVVAALRTIIPKGESTVATLKSIQEAETKVKNRKKGEYIKSKIQSTDFGALVSQWNARQDTVRGASFMQSQAGEPRLQGILFTMTPGQISQPIIGNNGVFLVSPITDKTQNQVPTDLTMFRRQLSSTATVSVRTNLIKSMIKEAAVRDNRARFF